MGVPISVAIIPITIPITKADIILNLNLYAEKPTINPINAFIIAKYKC